MIEHNEQNSKASTSDDLSCYQTAFEHLCQHPVFDLTQAEKTSLLLPVLAALQTHHTSHCAEFANILAAQPASLIHTLENLPYVAVRLFKLLNLKSIADSDVYRTLRSSGTTGQVTAQVALDRQTSQRQSKTLVSILQQILGKRRLPMLIIDAPSTVQRGTAFNARGAGIQGLMFFGKDHTYALNDDMSLNELALASFSEKYSDEPVLVFGFTFMVWQYLINQLARSPFNLQLPKATLLHSGGWKKLESQKVDNSTFKQRVLSTVGIHQVHNFYGMAEQVGSVFLECSEGHLHAPSMADVIVRRTDDLSPCDIGEAGIVQVLSAIPSSYPGHSILTEDMGVILGEDDCPCGWKGRYFSILERLPKAELRGCSDTHAQHKEATNT